MDGGIIEIALYASAGCLLGAFIGWSVQAFRSKRRIGQLTSAAKRKINEVAAKYTESQAQLEQIEADSASLFSELESTREKSRKLVENVRLLRKERENTKSKLGTLQNALSSFKRQTSDLQTEFNKTRDFYKRELLKSLQKRKELEEDILNARAEQVAFAHARESSVLEHGSEEEMIIAAQLRLGQLKVLERNVNKLEAENRQLSRDIKRIRQEFDAREKDLRELEQLKLNNRQLVQAVEALEDSRKEYEADAERFREKAGQSEELSNTLRLKLDDLQKNFADIEKQQNDAIEDVRNAAVVPILRNQG